MSSSVNQIASQFLRELEIGNVTSSKINTVVEHVTRRQSTLLPCEETAAQFLNRMRYEFAALPDAQPVAERIEVEAPKVVIRVGRARFFHGFLRGRLVAGFDAQLATEMTVEEANKIQSLLTSLGHETEQQPSLAKAVA